MYPSPSTTTSLSEQAVELVLRIWGEQYAMGIGDIPPTAELVDEWVVNRTYPPSVLEHAAAGDVAALAQVRAEAGLPLFC